MSDDNKFINLNTSGLSESMRKAQEVLKGIKINPSLYEISNISAQSNISHLLEHSEEMNRQMEEAFEEKRRKETQRDEWLRTIAENTTAIKNNSDKLVLSMEDLIDVIVVSNNISEANMILIDERLQKIVENGNLNIVDEVKKTTLGLATQKGLEVGYVFLLKALPYIDTFLKGLGS